MRPHFLQGNGYTIGFSSQKVTAWGGMGLLKQMWDSLGFPEALRSWSLPPPGSNRAYNPFDLAEQFVVATWIGASRYSHLSWVRHDNALSDIFGWEKMPETKAYSRFFERFDLECTEIVQRQSVQWVMQKISPSDTLTLDVDSTVITRSGSQEGAVKGYNPKKHGRKSHHPLLAFLGDQKLAVNFWLRPGNAHTSNNIIPFLESTFSNLGGRKINLLRADSGFYDEKVFSFLDDRKIGYIVAAPLTNPIQSRLHNHEGWETIAPGIEICEFVYKAKNWSIERRFIGVRKSPKIRKDATGKNLPLFPICPKFEWRYNAYATNSRGTARDIWALYRSRANAENQIKALKADFGLDSFNMHKFWATEATLVFCLFAYNLMGLFRRIVARTKIQHGLATLHGMLLAVGAIWRKNNHLLICLPKERRRWFRDMWQRATDPPEYAW